MGSGRKWSRTPPRRERGSVIVYTAVFLGALLASTTVALDIGSLYTAQRDLQRAANLAALDAAEVAGGCYGNQNGLLQSDPLQLATTEVQSSLVRNNVSTGYLGGNGVQIGHLVSAGGNRTFVPLTGGAAISGRTAVQVTLTRATPKRLLPFGTAGTMQASVAADIRPAVSLSVGSGLAAVNGGIANALLGGLLGGSLNLTVAQYQGLASTNIRLGDLAIAAHAATVDDFLTASTSLPSAINDILNGLGSGSSGAVRSTLTALAAAASQSRSVTPGSVLLAPLGLSDGGENALVNVGDLIMGLAASANGNNAITLPINTALGSAKITLIEKPQLAVILAGDQETYVSTAQTKVDLNIGLNNVNLGIPGVLGLTVTVAVPLQIRAGKATANLEEVNCARRGQLRHEVDIASTTSPLDLGIGTFSSPIGSAAPAVTPATIGDVSLTILGIKSKIANVTAAAYGGLSAQHGADTFVSPYPLTHSQSTDLSTAMNNLVGDLIASLGKPNGLKVTLLPGVLPPVPVGTITAGVLTQLKVPLNLISASLEPVLAMLGVTVGNADVQVVSMVPFNSNSRTTQTTDGMSLQAFLFNH